MDNQQVSGLSPPLPAPILPPNSKMNTNISTTDAAILEKKKKAFDYRIVNVNKQVTNLYTDKHDAPFLIFIERVDFQQNYDLKNFSDFSFGKKLANIAPVLMKNSYNLKKS